MTFSADDHCATALSAGWPWRHSLPLCHTHLLCSRHTYRHFYTFQFTATSHSRKEKVTRAGAMHIVIISLDNVWMLQRINKRNSYRVTSLPAQCRSTKQSRRKLRGDTFRRRNIHDSVAARASYPQHTRPPKRVTWVETFNGQTQSSLVIVIWLSGYTGSPIHSHVLGKIPGFFLSRDTQLKISHRWGNGP